MKFIFDFEFHPDCFSILPGLNAHYYHEDRSWGVCGGWLLWTFHIICDMLEDD